jgi:hypothetical protein
MAGWKGTQKGDRGAEENCECSGLIQLNPNRPIEF